MVHRGLYSYQQRIHVTTLLPNIVFVLFLYVERFCKSFFEWKVWRVQLAHLHSKARALSSPSRCFQLSTNLGKDFFRYLWYCDKKQIECGLAWYLWNSTDLGLIDMFLINLNTEIVACILLFRKSRHKPNLQNTTKYGFSLNLGEKNGGVLSMRIQVILDTSFARPGSAPIWGGKKEEFRDWTTTALLESIVNFSIWQIERIDGIDSTLSTSR